MQSYNWKDEFRADLVRELINTGNTRLLMDAFVWQTTPEGSTYWCDIYGGDRKLTPDVKQRLQEMLDEYEGKPKAKPKALTPLQTKIVEHIKRAGHITARDAMVDIGITSASLSRRICDLEANGFKIERERRVHPVSGQRYTRYKLAA